MAVDTSKLPAVGDLMKAFARLVLGGDRSAWDRALVMPHYAAAGMPLLSSLQVGAGRCYTGRLASSECVLRMQCYQHFVNLRTIMQIHQHALACRCQRKDCESPNSQKCTVITFCCRLCTSASWRFIAGVSCTTMAVKQQTCEPTTKPQHLWSATPITCCGVCLCTWLPACMMASFHHQTSNCIMLR